jgi:hypothetical protein
MKDTESTTGWTRRGLLGAASLGAAAPLVAAMPSTAWAKQDSSPEGVAHRLAQLVRLPRRVGQHCRRLAQDVEHVVPPQLNAARRLGASPC